MKTFEDCKDRIINKRRFTDGGNMLAYKVIVNEAAELYGRYMRFVGRAQKAREQAVIRANPALLSSDNMFPFLDEYHTMDITHIRERMKYLRERFYAPTEVYLEIHKDKIGHESLLDKLSKGEI